MQRTTSKRERKTEVIQFRVTLEELAIIASAAEQDIHALGDAITNLKELRISPSGWARAVVLSAAKKRTER